MGNLFYIFSGIVSLLLGGIQLCMLVRAVLSWLPLDDDNPILQFTYAVTEPCIIPIRMILERFEFFASSPLDISFFVTFLLLSFLQSIL